MNPCYKQLEIQNLDIIRKKTLELCPVKDWTYTHIFHIDNDIERFYKISELTEELKRLGFYGKIFRFALLVVKPKEEVPIHSDTGFTYSFNIPIMGCENTTITWYKSSGNPIPRKTAQNSVYLVYPSETCEAIDTFDMRTPAVINVKIPHKITNNNVNMTLPRITLLIRINKDVDVT